jgi:hypothetical protein
MDEYRPFWIDARKDAQVIVEAIGHAMLDPWLTALWIRSRVGRISADIYREGVPVEAILVYVFKYEVPTKRFGVSSIDTRCASHNRLFTRHRKLLLNCWCKRTLGVSPKGFVSDDES